MLGSGQFWNRLGSRVITRQVYDSASKDDATLKFCLPAFATLLVVVDPFGVLPIFSSLARNRRATRRNRLATRAVVLLGFMIVLFFVVAGSQCTCFSRGVGARVFDQRRHSAIYYGPAMVFGQRAARLSDRLWGLGALMRLLPSRVGLHARKREVLGIFAGSARGPIRAEWRQRVRPAAPARSSVPTSIPW